MRSAKWKNRSNTGRYCLAGGVVLLLLLFPASSLQAEDPTFDEFEVKATYLYHFGRFITWPDETWNDLDDAFVIGIIGEDPFGKKIDDRLLGRKIDDRKVEIRRYVSLDEEESSAST
jgi:hypothetical protein